MRRYGGRVLLAVAVAAAGCGDPETNDRRGYTKAPLENPGLIVRGEAPGAMAALSQTNRPRPRLDIADAREAGEEEAAAGEQVALAPGVTQEQFDLGRELFTGQGGCQACHGPQAGGTQLGPDLTDGEWLHVSGPDPEELARVIREGVPQPRQYAAPMPAMGGADLDDPQIEALAAYLASIGQG